MHAVGIFARVRARVGSLRLDVELETGSGTLVLIGPNGAGKSSLLKCLVGALPVDEGRIQIGAHVLVDSASRLNVPVEARRLGFLPQDYALFPHLSVAENVAFALKCAEPTVSRVDQSSRVKALLCQLGLEAHSERKPMTLSGGEKQRLGLARALATQPRALLLDEPLSALDVRVRGEVRGYLADTLKRLSLPTIVVTHDAADARALGERIAVLEDGHVVHVGTWGELQAAPETPFVKAFVAGEPT